MLAWSRWGCRRLADSIWLLAHDNNNNWTWVCRMRIHCCNLSAITAVLVQINVISDISFACNSWNMHYIAGICTESVFTGKAVSWPQNVILRYGSLSLLHSVWDWSDRLSHCRLFLQGLNARIYFASVGALTDDLCWNGVDQIVHFAVENSCTVVPVQMIS